MPLIPKDWHNFPTQTDTPVNRPGLQGLESRVGNYAGAVASVGPGVDNWESFRVKQHSSGDMSVDVGLANQLMAAYIDLSTDGTGSIERYEYNGLQLNQAIAAADPANPRIDQVVLLPGVTDSQVPTTAVIVGTPTAGATLDNRNGAAALPVQRIRLADVLVPAAATQILTANLRERRPVGIKGCLPFAPMLSPALPPIDQALLEPNPLMSITTTGTLAAAQTNFQVAASVFLSRRTIATKLRWQYVQGGSALTGNYIFAIFDASGQLIVTSSVTALAGAANSFQQRNETIPITTFQAGWYHVFFGVASLAGGTIVYPGVVTANTAGSSIGAAAQQIAFVRPASGTAVGQNFVVDGMGDIYTSAAVACPPVPIVTLAAQ